MSRVLRIAIVAEGITDYVVLSAAVKSILGARPYSLHLLQPEESKAFTGHGNAGPLGGGWPGGYKWCVQAAERSGQLRDDPLFFTYDLLVLHLDADVASENPGAHVPSHPLASELPCHAPCPPAKATTDRLRTLMLSWVGERETPPGTVLCTPSKSTEAWVMAMFFPGDRQMDRTGWECFGKPENRLPQQPLARRFSKREKDYRARLDQMRQRWPDVVDRLSEASRFQTELLTALH